MDRDTDNWWELAIARNRAALTPIVTALFFMAGLDEGGAATLPRRVYRRILLVLRPAETALRRLIMIAAHGIVVTVRAPAAPKYVPWWAVRRRAQAKAAKAAPAETGRRAASPPVVAAMRPREAKPRPVPAHEICRRFGLAWAGPLPGPETPAARVPAFRLFDPLKRFAFEPGPAPAPPGRFGIAPDDETGALRICRRVAALKAALDDIGGEAIRLARMQARANHAWLSGGHVRGLRSSPLRAGWPPGWRKRPVHAVDGILRECDTLARNLPAKDPDTS